MNWTSTLPAKPGYYWLRNFLWPDCEAVQKQPMIVNLEADMNGELAAVELYRETSITEISGEWYGPITAPE